MSTIAVLGALLAATPVPADEIAEQWVVRYNGPANQNDRATAVAVDASGNVIVTGSSLSPRPPNSYLEDYYTAKYAATTGALLWEKRYNGAFGDIDIPAALALDASGNVFVTGYSKTTFNGTGNHFDYYTAKYAAADGALLWEKIYVGLAGRDDEASALAVDSGGNAIVTGNSTDVNFQKKLYTAKYAALDGALLWEQYGPASGPASPDPEVIAVDGNDNVVVAGASTIKYAAANGTVLWTKTNPALSASAVAIDGGGDVTVTGYSFAAGHPTAFTSKYAGADGALLWAKTRANTVIQGAALDGSGNAVVTGYTGDGNTYSYYTAKYAAADGAVVWEQGYHGPGIGQDIGKAVALDGSGNVFVTGSSVGPSGGYEYYTAAYAAGNGALLWEKRYAGPAASNSSVGLASTPDGGVVVTGYSDSSTSSTYNFDFATVKYAPADTETRAASDVGITSATFNGAANRAGLATSARYEWGTTPALGNVTADQAIGAGLASLSVPVPISGLPAGGTIYFRIRTENSAGVKYGATLSFTTYSSFTVLQAWKFSHLSDAAAPDAADADHDGQATIVEYALGTPPETPNMAPGVDAFNYAEGRRLRMFVPRDPAHNDVTVEVQAAALPNGPWTSVATSTLGAPFAGPGYVDGDDAGPGVKMVEIRDTVNVSDAALRFMRVQVTHPAAGGAAVRATTPLRKIAPSRKGLRILR